MERRDFLALSGSALLAGCPGLEARQDAGKGVNFLYSGLFGFASYEKKLKVLFIDANKAGHGGSVHSPMLMMRLEDYEPKPLKDDGRTEHEDAIPRPQVLTFGDEKVAIWGLAGRLVWCDGFQSSYDQDAAPDLTVTDRQSFINLGEILKSSGGPIKTPVKNWNHLSTHILMTRGQAKAESIDSDVCYWYVTNPSEAEKKPYASQLSVAHPAPGGKAYLDLLVAKRSSGNSEAPVNAPPHRLRIKCPAGWPQVTMVNAPLTIQTNSAHFEAFFNIVEKRKVSLHFGDCPGKPKLSASDYAYEHPFVGCVPAEMPQ